MLSRIFRLVMSVPARKLVVRKAACEVLEQRQLLAATSLGDLPGGYRAELRSPNANPGYRFNVEGAMRINLSLAGGSVVLTDLDDGTILAHAAAASGKGAAHATHTLGTGRYELQVKAGPQAALGISARRVPALAPTRLEASVWGGKAIRLNWDDNADTEVRYRVDRWTKQGWRRSVRVGQDATAAVIDNLPLGSKTTYRVSAVSDDGGSVQSLNTVTAQTLTEDTSGWYKVKINAASTGAAEWSMKDDTIRIWPEFQKDGDRQSKWVYATSWQSAVYQYATTYRDVNGTLQDKPVKIDTGKVDANGDRVYVYHSFPSGGAFKVGTVAEIKQQVTAESNNNGGFKATGVVDADKVISVEDSYGSIDRDFDDFYWKVDVEKLKVEIELRDNLRSAATEWNPNAPDVWSYTRSEATTFIFLKFPSSVPWDVAKEIVPAISRKQEINPQNTNADPTVYLYTAENNFSGTTTFYVESPKENRKNGMLPNNRPSAVQFWFEPRHNSVKMGDESSRLKIEAVFDYLTFKRKNQEALLYVMWKYEVPNTWDRADDAVVYTPDEGAAAHTAGAYENLTSMSGRGKRTTTVGDAAYTSENKLASTLMHESVHAGQSDYYFRPICPEIDAERPAYNYEFSQKGWTGLRGGDLTELQQWVDWVNGNGPRPNGGH